MSSSPSAELRQQTQSKAQLGSLPVFDDVQDYEKIKRIGEGTYGVVCKLSAQLCPA